MKTRMKIFLTNGVIFLILVVACVNFWFENYHYAYYGYKEFGEHFKTLDEVKILYEKYDDVKIAYSMNSALSYDVHNRTRWSGSSLSLEVYHDEVDHFPHQLILRCYKFDRDKDERGVISSHQDNIYDDDILEYLNNDQCSKRP